MGGGTTGTSTPLLWQLITHAIFQYWIDRAALLFCTIASEKWTLNATCILSRDAGIENLSFLYLHFIYSSALLISRRENGNTKLWHWIHWLPTYQARIQDFCQGRAPMDWWPYMGWDERFLTCGHDLHIFATFQDVYCHIMLEWCCTTIQGTLLWISDPVRPCFLAITSSNQSQLVSNFHTIHFSSSADIHQYGLLTKYQNLGYLSLTRNVKFRPVHLLVQWRLERRRLWRQ